MTINILNRSIGNIDIDAISIVLDKNFGWRNLKIGREEENVTAEKHKKYANISQDFLILEKE